MKRNKTARLLSGLNVCLIIALTVFTVNAQTVLPQTTTPTTPPPTQQSAPLSGRQAGTPNAGQATTTQLPANQLSSSQFFAQDGFTVERLVESGFNARPDLLAARQRLAIAQGNLIQAGLRPNPTLDAELGSPRFLGGEAESDLSVGASQIFETGGKRRKRVTVAELALAQTRADVLALERIFAAGIRAAYARVVTAARQLDTLENLIAANTELVRITNERVQEGDVAPIDLNLVQLESDRLRANVITMRANLEGELISIRTLVGLEPSEPLQLARLPLTPPRLELSLAEATDIALRERADLQSARLGEDLGNARIRLAESSGTPNVAASIRYSRARGIFDLPESLGANLNATDTDNELTFGVSIGLPVFNRNQGQIASAVGEREQAVRQREFLEASIRSQVALSFRRYRAAAESYVLYSTQIVPRAEENLRSVRAAYNLGEYSVFDIVNEQRRLIESQTGLNEASANYYLALAELERVLGTTIPASGFAPEGVSVLPDNSIPKFKPDAGRQALKSFSLVATPSASTSLDVPTATTTSAVASTTVKPEHE